jgi:hypothetical protein
MHIFQSLRTYHLEKSGKTLKYIYVLATYALGVALATFHSSAREDSSGAEKRRLRR